MSRTLEARGTSIDFTRALLAPNIPRTLYSGAILSFVDRGASTARFKFVGGVKALEIARKTTRASNGTCGETHRTKLRGGGIG